MGNHRFRLADMIPNAWFYKLKDMSQRASKNHSGRSKSTRVAAAATAAASPKAAQPLHRKLLPNRASCYYSSRAEAERYSFSASHSKSQDTHFPVESPRKSKKRSRKKPAAKPKLVGSADPEINTNVKQLCSVSSGCRCRAWKPQSTHDQFPPALSSPETPTPTGQRHYYIDGENLLFDCDEWDSWPPACSCRVTSSATDIVIDMTRKNSTDESERKLPPILTKPAPRQAEFPTQSEDKTSVTNRSYKSRAKKTSPGLQRLRLRANSPRLASRKAHSHRGKRLTSSAVQPQQRKGLPASFAVVKASSDPQRDFRDSMMEMIEENNIRASLDLEELLACYLSLNSNEYHDVIVKVFQQIWFDLTNNRL